MPLYIERPAPLSHGVVAERVGPGAHVTYPLRAREGQWIVELPEGHVVMDDSEFQAKYELAPPDEPTQFVESTLPVEEPPAQPLPNLDGPDTLDD